MRQKCVWISVVFLVAISGAIGSQECAQERANECKEKLFEILFGDSTEEEACGQLHGVSKCLRKVVEDCLDEEERGNVEESFKEFEDLLDNNCGETSEGDDDEIGNCLEENQDYLLQCVFDKETGEISSLLDIESIPDGISLDFAQCYLYGLMAHCVVSRSEEKCGEVAGELAAKEFTDMPPSVQKSCDSQQESMEAPLHDFIFLSDQRKKRDLGNRKKRNFEYFKKRDLGNRKKRSLDYIKKRALEYKK